MGIIIGLLSIILKIADEAAGCYLLKIADDKGGCYISTEDSR